MSRSAVIFLLLACPALLEAQDAWIEQFDGKTLQGWEIDGDGKLENGVLKLGGSGGALLRLKAPLGDKFSFRLEYRYEGPSMPVLNWETNAPYPSTWQFHGIPGQWIEMTMNVTAGNWLNPNSGSYSYRTIDNMGGSQGSGGMMAGSGRARDLVIVVQPNTTLMIRRISLQTTPPPPPVGRPWIAIAVLVGLLLGVMALGWFLNRRRSRAALAG